MVLYNGLKYCINYRMIFFNFANAKNVNFKIFISICLATLALTWSIYCTDPAAVLLLTLNLALGDMFFVTTKNVNLIPEHQNQFCWGFILLFKYWEFLPFPSTKEPCVCMVLLDLFQIDGFIVMSMAWIIKLIVSNIFYVYLVYDMHYNDIDLYY